MGYSCSESGNRKQEESEIRNIVCTKKLESICKEEASIKKSIETKIQLGSTGETSSPGIVMQGSRVINIENMKEYTEKVARHAASCDGSINLTSESRNGLASVFTGECSTCGHSVTLETSKKVKGPKGYNRSVKKSS